MASRGKSQGLARARILKARGSVCERCGRKGYVELHHKRPFKYIASHSDGNVLLLCDTCHRKAHGYKPRAPSVATWAEM